MCGSTAANSVIEIESSHASTSGSSSTCRLISKMISDGSARHAQASHFEFCAPIKLDQRVARKRANHVPLSRGTQPVRSPQRRVVRAADGLDSGVEMQEAFTSVVAPGSPPSRWQASTGSRFMICDERM